MLTVDTYIEQFPEDIQKRLQQLRTWIKQVAKQADEQISYGVIGYKYHNKPLVYFGGYKTHIGFYATPNGQEAFKQELKKYKQGKGSVQFPNSEPLPTELIKRIVEFRLKSIQEKVNS
jgi:uncharacterized protein YdhG (YjbR/CyaY superfamily)